MLHRCIDRSAYLTAPIPMTAAACACSADRFCRLGCCAIDDEGIGKEEEEEEDEEEDEEEEEEEDEEEARGGRSRSRSRSRATKSAPARATASCNRDDSFTTSPERVLNFLPSSPFLRTEGRKEGIKKMQRCM